MDATEAVAESPAMPHGDSGEDRISSVPFQVLSWKPRVVYFPKFATAEQCQAIIKIAKPSLEPSKLALREGETPENTRGVRTSTGTFLTSSEDPTGTLDLIELKNARVTMIPREQGEECNILHYEIRQSYESHYDAFNPKEYGSQYSQRNGLNMNINYDYRQCIGLKVKPRQGDALLFYSVFTNGTIDQRSLHGSCPVIKVEKWNYN